MSSTTRERFIEAVMAGDVDGVGTALAEGANPNIRVGELGETMLHNAAVWNAQIIDTLVRAGVNLNARDRNGNTPLHYAVLNENVSAVRRLLEAGAHPDFCNAELETPLTRACWHSPPIEIMRALLDAGAHPDGRGVRMTCRAAESESHECSPPLSLVIMNQSLDKMRLLIERGASLDVRSSFGDTLLITAIKYCGAGVPILLQAGANVDDTNTYNQTALICAVHFSNVNTVKVLLNAGANVLAVDAYGKTAREYVLNWPFDEGTNSSRVSVRRELASVMERAEDIYRQHGTCAGFFDVP